MDRVTLYTLAIAEGRPRALCIGLEAGHEIVHTILSITFPQESSVAKSEKTHGIKMDQLVSSPTHPQF